MSPYVYSLRLAKLWWFGGFCLVALVIYGSLATGGPIVPVTFSDKLQHLVAYGVLAAYFGGIVKRRALWGVLLLLFFMSVGLEYLQAAGGVRQFEYEDMAYNGLGLALGKAFSRVGFRYWCRTIERWVLA